MEIWKDGMEVATMVYQLTMAFPSDEKFGLVNQLRRCAVSIPSNIAEGCSRSSDKELAHFIKIALGSTFEMETQLILSKQLHFSNEKDLDEIINKVVIIQKRITNFLKTLEPKQ
ncbi:four helix bundle protein [Sphingobacterium hungaricum]|uniref:four helix bundle protein n=1 Tax=Sphingobacterium hungaricum TaxID=2082723 RepID=UPI001E5E99AA|nr:four helix bundle protein [Sphingobacterium hungaricum]